MTAPSQAQNAPVPISPEQARINELRNFLNQGRGSLALAIPKTMAKHLTPERMIQLAVTATRRNPALLECTPLSIAASIVEASQLGLTCDGVLGEGYLVPRWSAKAGRKLCSFQPGYRGLIALARRTGTVETIDGEAVFEGDHFSYSKGLNDKLEHVSTSEVQTKETLTHVWARIRFKGGGYQFKVLTKAQVESIRKRSQSPDAGPWVSDYPAMAIKTAIRQLMKLCDLSPEVARTVAIDEGLETGSLDPALKDDVPLDPEPTQLPEKAQSVPKENTKPQTAPKTPDPVAQATNTPPPASEGHGDPATARQPSLDPFIDGETEAEVLPPENPAPPANRTDETAQKLAARRRRMSSDQGAAPAK